MATDIAAPLPDVEPRELTTYTVTLDDPAAIITSIVLHGSQQLPSDGPPPFPVPKLTLDSSAGGPGGT